MSLQKPSRLPKPTSRSVRTPVLVALGMFVFVCFAMPGFAQDSNLAAIQTLIRQSKLADADKQLQAILQKQPANAKAMVLLGVVRRQQGDWPEAETQFRRALASSPQSVEACEDLAALLRDEARWPEAVTQYESCRKLAPRNFNVATELAAAY